jgi:DNA-binding response OmpR family regulator
MERCILLVDDDSMIRAMLARALGGAGYAVLQAANGRMALQVLERGGVEVDLVVTDLTMPELDGAALGRRIAESRPDLPVLYMSAGTFDAVGAGGSTPPPFLPKPFSPSALLDLIEARLGSGSSRHLVSAVAAGVDRHIPTV